MSDITTAARSAMTNQERGRSDRGVDEDRDAKKRPVGFGSTPAHAHVETGW